MNEMFTELARKSIEHARDEAARLRHDYIGTEHLLLGLIRLGEGRAIDVMTNLGLDLMDLKSSIEEVVQPSGTVRHHRHTGQRGRHQRRQHRKDHQATKRVVSEVLLWLEAQQ